MKVGYQHHGAPNSLSVDKESDKEHNTNKTHITSSAPLVVAADFQSDSLF